MVCEGMDGGGATLDLVGEDSEESIRCSSLDVREFNKSRSGSDRP